MSTSNYRVLISSRVIFPVVLLFSLFGCTVTETINDILSSTTPGSWYTGEGLIKEEYKPHAFVAINLDNLKNDLAKGQGEYLASLTNLLHVPSERHSQFFALVQQHYPNFAQEQEHIRVTQALIALSRSFAVIPGG